MNLESILQKVSEITGVPVKAMKQKNRKRDVVTARNAYMYISRQLTSKTLIDIAFLVKKTHPTVVRVVNFNIDAIMQADILAISEKFTNIKDDNVCKYCGQKL